MRGGMIILGLCEPRQDTGSAFTEHPAEASTRSSSQRHFSIDGIQGKCHPKPLKSDLLSSKGDEAI